MSHWYENKDGSTKTHNRVRTCEQCRENPKCGCTLPFRKARKVRWLAALDKKPALFRSLRFSKFTRSNALAQGRAACGESLGAGGSAANDKEKANA